MKTKKLANVLIKILGLSLISHGIPSIITTSLPFLHSWENSTGRSYWLYPFAYVIQVAIGIYLIVQSREVAAFLFKDDDE